VGAKRVVLDTIEVLFGAFGDDAIVRSELIRLVRWLEDRGVTAILTGERGDGEGAVSPGTGSRSTSPTA
jgi:circadian clock protein KaiC